MIYHILIKTTLKGIRYSFHLHLITFFLYQMVECLFLISNGTKIMEVSPHLYLGGVADELRRDPDVKRRLEFSGRPAVPGFVGCLRQVRFEVGSLM